MLAVCLLTTLLLLLAATDSRHWQHYSSGSPALVVHMQPGVSDASEQSETAMAGSAARPESRSTESGSALPVASAHSSSVKQDVFSMPANSAEIPQSAGRQAEPHRALEGAALAGDTVVPDSVLNGVSETAMAVVAGRATVFLFAGVLSGRGYRHRRLAVREAWAQRAQARRGSLRPMCQ